MATEREKLTAAIQSLRDCANHTNTEWRDLEKLVYDAAQKYLDSLPASEDYAIIGRKSDDTVFVYTVFGTHLMSASEANRRAVVAREDFPNTTYVVVKVSA